MSTVAARRVVGVALMIVVAGCAAEGTAPDPTAAMSGLPARVTAVDTSTIGSAAHSQGGSVLITLTGIPTPASLDLLSQTGLLVGVSMDPNAPPTPTVTGYVERATIRKLAALPFVTRIEWAAASAIPLVGHPQLCTGPAPCPGG